MNIHKNARLTPYLRVRIVERIRAKQQTPRIEASSSTRSANRGCRLSPFSSCRSRSWKASSIPRLIANNSIADSAVCLSPSSNC